MPPRLREPCYCTDYVPSGMPVPEKRADWREEATRLYLAGAKYPRDGLIVSDERIAHLAGSDNLMGYPLIVKVEDEAPVENEAQKPTRKRVKKDADRNL